MKTAPDTIRLLRFAFVGTVATMVHLATSLLLMERVNRSARDIARSIPSARGSTSNDQQEEQVTGTGPFRHVT